MRNNVCLFVHITARQIVSIKVFCASVVFCLYIGGWMTAIHGPRPGRCPEIPEILKFVLIGPEIGVRS